MLLQVDKMVATLMRQRPVLQNVKKTGDDQN